MAIPPTTELDASARHSLLLLALAAVGPCFWFLDLVAIYAVSTHECGVSRSAWLLTVFSALVVAAALGYGVQRHRARDPKPFLVLLSLMLNGLSLLLLVSFAAPLALLRPCE